MLLTHWPLEAIADMLWFIGFVVWILGYSSSNVNVLILGLLIMAGSGIIRLFGKRV